MGSNGNAVVSFSQGTPRNGASGCIWSLLHQLSLVLYLDKLDLRFNFALLDCQSDCYI